MFIRSASSSILDEIGNTPLIEIKALNPNPDVKIFAKLEYVNPGGSIKDRPALQMIEEGERSGALTHDKTVIEATSGNTGIGLAMVCAVKGYRLLLAMSESASVERRKILQARGAEILLTPGHKGTDGAIEEVYRMARENPDLYFVTDQFNNEANWQAHYHGTGEEIWRQTGGKIRKLVATIGTTGTLMGVSRRLKEYDPNVVIIGVEPYLGHKLQGLKNLKEAYCPGIFEKARVDKKVNIDDEDAFEMTRRLAREEGLFVGMSSGAAMVIAADEAKEMTEGVIVTIFPDSGERYLSTPLFTVREKVDLRLFNTMSRTRENFIPRRPGKAAMYTCGPAADARLHPGGYRRFVFADLLGRYLKFRGYSVKHVINITDLDDRTIAGSEKAEEDISKFTRRQTDLFLKDLDLLGIEPADAYPRSSEYTGRMVEIAKKLAGKGFAYEKLRSLYFDISRYADYGALSGVDLNKIRIGATVDLDEYEKENPRDFTLLKRSRLPELKRGIYLSTEWGNVRPSWSLQCAAIGMKFFGDTLDIRVSSRELIFPHHENEIAIASAVTQRPFAGYWIHCDRALVDGKKVGPEMNSPALDDLIEMGYTGRQIRYWLLSHHYSKPVTFSTDRLNHAEKSLKRLNTFVQSLIDVQDGESYPEIDQLLYDTRQGFIQAMDDDLNISAALASIFRIVKKLNRLMLEKRIDRSDADKIIDVFQSLNTVLNVFDFDMDKKTPPEVRDLIEQRNAARSAGNFSLADEIRDRLIRMGVTVRDARR